MPAADPAEFRALMSRFATGVTVVTTLDQNKKPVGMTASAVASVSLDPPTLLLCINRQAELRAELELGSTFALNILAASQEVIATRFAAHEYQDRFSGVAYSAGPGGVPLLSDTVAHIHCQVSESREVGDHTVFFGRVTGGEAFDRIPLIHFSGKYASTTEG